MRTFCNLYKNLLKCPLLNQTTPFSSNFITPKNFKIIWFSKFRRSQVGFLKKSPFKESSGILLVFSPTYLFTLFQGRWIQKSMLAIRKMSFNVTKWRTKWLPKKQYLRTNHIQHCSLMDPMRVGMLEYLAKF